VEVVIMVMAIAVIWGGLRLRGPEDEPRASLTPDA
jgi:hypothetical protein